MVCDLESMADFTGVTMSDMVSGVAGLMHSALPKAVGGALDAPALPVADACALQLLVEVIAGAPVWAGQALVVLHQKRPLITSPS